MLLSMPFLPVELPVTSIVLAVALAAAGVVALLVIVTRGARRRAGAGDIVIVYNPDGLSTSYLVEPLVPPSLYTYKCQSTELCLLLVRSPPITYQDPRTKVIRRLWLAVEQNGLALTLSPEEVHTISAASEVIGDYNVDDILLLVKTALDKKSYSEHVKLPGGFRVAFTYKVYPAVARVVTELLKSDAVALSSILSALRTAREAKSLAEAVALRKEVEIRRFLYIGILVMLVFISIAILLSVRGG